MQRNTHCTYPSLCFPQLPPDKLKLLLTPTNLFYLHGLCLVHCFDCCLCHGSCCKSHKCTTWGKKKKEPSHSVHPQLLGWIKKWKCLEGQRESRKELKCHLKLQKAPSSKESWTVGKASCLPRLRPSGPRNILHSSICPKGENITRISFSLHFLDIIPINNFLSSTAKKSKDNSITSKYVFTRYYFVKSSPGTAVTFLLFRGEAC